jgi:hypothetical protein
MKQHRTSHCVLVPSPICLAGNRKYPAMKSAVSGPHQACRKYTAFSCLQVSNRPVQQLSGEVIQNDRTCVQHWCSIHLCHGCARHAALADHASMRIVSFPWYHPPWHIGRWSPTRSLSLLPDTALFGSVWSPTVEWTIYPFAASSIMSRRTRLVLTVLLSLVRRRGRILPFTILLMPRTGRLPGYGRRVKLPPLTST